jgi:hypothetical protein
MFGMCDSRSHFHLCLILLELWFISIRTILNYLVVLLSLISFLLNLDYAMFKMESLEFYCAKVQLAKIA